MVGRDIKKERGCAPRFSFSIYLKSLRRICQLGAAWHRSEPSADNRCPLGFDAASGWRGA